MQALLRLGHSLAETFVTVLKNVTVNEQNGAKVRDSLSLVLKLLSDTLTGNLAPSKLDAFVYINKTVLFGIVLQNQTKRAGGGGWIENSVN